MKYPYFLRIHFSMIFCPIFFVIGMATPAIAKNKNLANPQATQTKKSKGALKTPEPPFEGILKNPFVPKTPRKEEPVEVAQTDDRPRQPETTSQPEVPRPNFRISGLVWNSNRPQAILNDQVVNIGDSVSGWTITKISKDGVEVTTEKTTFLIEP